MSAKARRQHAKIDGKKVYIVNTPRFNKLVIWKWISYVAKNVQLMVKTSSTKRISPFTSPKKSNETHQKHSVTNKSVTRWEEGISKHIKISKDVGMSYLKREAILVSKILEVKLNLGVQLVPKWVCYSR